MTDKEYLSINDIQKSYGLSRSSLLKFEEQGQLHPGRTPGGHRRYKRDELDALLSPVEKKAGAVPLPFSTTAPIVTIPDNFERARPNRPDTYSELGTTGLRRFGGSVVEEQLRELQGREGRAKFREMRLNDAVLSAVFFGLSHALKQATWRVQPASESGPDKKAAEFIDECINDMTFTWLDELTFIIDPMLEQGFSLLELVYKRRLGNNPSDYVPNPAQSKFNDGRIGWRKWCPRPAESLAPGQEWMFDQHGGVQGINQYDYYGTGQAYSVPIAKLLHFRTSVHPANTPEPPPIHRAAYLPYFFTQNLQEIEGIGIERDLGGLPVMYLGNDATSIYDDAKTMVTNIRVDEQSGVVIPYAKMGAGAAEGQGALLELLSANGSRAHDVSGVIERYDKRKALVVLAQFIMLGMDQVGSYALSRHQGDIFTVAASAWLKGIAGIINRYAIPRLMALNVFPGITAMPELVHSPLGIPNLANLADYVNKLVDKQIITPDEELERHLRQLADLPEKVEAVVKPTEEVPTGNAGPTTEGAPENLDSVKGLNGAQITAALDIAARVQEGLSATAGIELLTAMGMERATASLIIREVKNGPPIAPPEKVQPFGGNGVVKHAGAMVDLPCPFCGNGQIELHKDHGGAALCPNCEMAFNPEFHYGGQ